MRFNFMLEAEVERVTGKFASREEIEAELLQALSDANPDMISGVGADGGSDYEITSWEVI